VVGLQSIYPAVDPPIPPQHMLSRPSSELTHYRTGAVQSTLQRYKELQGISLPFLVLMNFLKTIAVREPARKIEEIPPLSPFSWAEIFTDLLQIR